MIDHYNLNPDYKRLCLENHYRLYLVDLIINKKNNDIQNARKLLTNKSSREKILLTLHRLHLSGILPIVRSLLPSRI